jgi:hypothetical protein
MSKSWVDRNIGKSSTSKIGAVVIPILLIAICVLVGLNLHIDDPISEQVPEADVEETTTTEKTFYLEDVLVGTGSVYKTYYFGGIIHDIGYGGISDTLVINTWEPGPICHVLYVPLYLNETISFGGHTFIVEDWSKTWITLQETQ